MRGQHDPQHFVFTYVLREQPVPANHQIDSPAGLTQGRLVVAK